MKQLILLTTAALLLGLLPQDSAVAQTANDQFRGSSWRLISGKVERGGKEVRLSAPRLQGFLIFDSQDHFLIVITPFRPFQKSHPILARREPSRTTKPPYKRA